MGVESVRGADGGSCSVDFFNVPSNPAGSTSMFVIHCTFFHRAFASGKTKILTRERTDAYFQPEAVEYKTVNNAASNFPTQHGVAIPVPAGDNSVRSGRVLNGRYSACSCLERGR